MSGLVLHQTWRERIERGELLGPRQIIASAVFDGPQPVWPGSVAIKDAAGARPAVAAAKAAGFDFIKIYSLLPRDAFFAVAEEAGKEHLHFAGHVPFSVRASEAAAAGMQCIEHLTGVVLECSSHEDAIRKAHLAAKTVPEVIQVLRETAKEQLDTYDEHKAAALFARLAQNRTWQCPTLTVARGSAFLTDPEFIKDDRLRYIPEEMRRSWAPRNDFRHREMTPEDIATRKRGYAKQLQIVGAMNRAGLRFVAGTDVGNPYCFPGFSLHDELGLLVEAGLSPLQALQAATSNAAELAGSSELGAVAAGKLADLVVLDANPLEDIHNTKKIAAVVFNGQYYPREALARMLATVEKLEKP
jgi:imidazolonepropionase-like amidohydrolase